MKIIVNKESGLSDIKTAIYYKSPIMPSGYDDLYAQYDSGRTYTDPGRDINVVSQGVYYNSGELGCDFRFFEYGLQFFLESGNPLESLGKSLEDLLTTSDGNFLGPRELKDLGKYIIPTNIEGTPGKLKYFGSFKTSNQEVYAFHAPAGISKIELYDEVLDPDTTYYDYDYGWNRGIKPKISIFLGVNEYSRVPQEYEGTERLLGPVPEYDLDSLGKLQDEIECDKMVFVVLEQKSRYGGIEISALGWTKLIEPLRNKQKEHLHSLSDVPGQLTETIPGMLFDGASGSIVGSKNTTSESPILKKKLERIDRTQYSPWKRYRLGDKVSYLGKSWISLQSENQGNNPQLSSYWALEEEMTNFFSTWFNIYSPNASIRLLGSLEDTTKINVPKYVKETVFSVYPKLGYIPEEKSVIKNQNSGIDFDIAYTENINPLEARYYLFYLIWSDQYRPAPGSTIMLPMKKKAIYPKIYIPTFLALSSNSSGWFDYSKIKEVDAAELSGGGYYTIGETLTVSLNEAIQRGLSRIESNTLSYNLPRLKFYVEKTTENPGTAEPEVEAIYDLENEDVQITLKDIIDYEEGYYLLKVDWDYRKITVSNAGDFFVEFPVANIIRTENFSTRLMPVEEGTQIDCLRVKYQGEWYRADWSGRSATWTPGTGYNTVTLQADNNGGYTLSVNNVSEELTIDVKVIL